MTDLLRKKSRVGDIILVMLGAFIMGLSNNLVYEPMGMVTGGISGLSIVIKSVSTTMFGYGVPVWMGNIVLNVPIFIASYLVLGKKFVVKTVLGAATFSFTLYIVPVYNMCGGDYLLAAVFGPLFMGGGAGLVFLASSSTGGTDMLSMVFHKYFKAYTVPQILAVIDGIIVLAGAAVFGVHNALYAVIAVFLTSKISDTIMEGFKFAKLVFIISDKYKDIAESILTDMDRGVTKINIKGMYTKEDKDMLFVVVSNKEIVQIKETVRRFDPNAFVIVSDVREAVGEGFVEY